MATIKNTKLIENLLVEADLQKLEAGAALHLRHGNISFKILKATAEEVTVQTVQGKNSAGVYQDMKTLIARTKELFAAALPGIKIHVHATPYAQAAPAIVTPEWLQEITAKTGIRVKDIATDTGLSKSNISAWMGGLRPMSLIVQAMFYYYFQSKQEEQN